MAIHLFLLIGQITLITWEGFVATVLWRWFVMQLFPEAPALTVPIAIGLQLICMLMFTRAPKEFSERPESERIEHSFKVLVFYTTVSILVLMVGWVVHLFV